MLLTKPFLFAFGVLLAQIFCCSIFAQETLLIRPQRAATPDSPEINVLFFAKFHPDDFAFAGGFFEVEAQEAEFTGAQYVPIQLHPPEPDGRFVRNCNPGQLHFPPAGIIADTTNPLQVVQATWQAVSFQPRDIVVETQTRNFWVYIDEASSTSESRMDTFEEGSGIIRVRRCYTDCDGDDETTIFDFLCFMNAFQAGDFYADCDESGTLDIFDFLCFQNEFMAGCP